MVDNSQSFTGRAGSQAPMKTTGTPSFMSEAPKATLVNQYSKGLYRRLSHFSLTVRDLCQRGAASNKNKNAIKKFPRKEAICVGKFVYLFIYLSIYFFIFFIQGRTRKRKYRIGTNRNLRNLLIGPLRLARLYLPHFSRVS